MLYKSYSSDSVRIHRCQILEVWVGFGFKLYRFGLGLDLASFQKSYQFKTDFGSSFSPFFIHISMGFVCIFISYFSALYFYKRVLLKI